MTTQELLETARAFCQLAERETNRDRGSLERAAQYAALAQAHATTAQAMMLYQVTTWTDDGLPRGVLTVARFDP